MYTINELMNQLEQMQIRRDDTVIIHISMKSVGEVQNGANGLLEAFQKYLNDGLFLVPTHTWAFIDKDEPTLDLMNPKTCIGIVPDCAAKHPLAKRSLNVTHSMAAFGNRASEYIMNEDTFDTPTPPGGCWGRLYQEKAKILLIGVGQERNTFLHAVDEMNNTPQRLSEQKKMMTIRYENGITLEHPCYIIFNPYCNDVSRYFPKFEPAFRKAGAVVDGKLGNANVQVCDACRCADTMLDILKRTNRDLCIDDSPIELFAN